MDRIAQVMAEHSEEPIAVMKLLFLIVRNRFRDILIDVLAEADDLRCAGGETSRVSDSPEARHTRSKRAIFSNNLHQIKGQALAPTGSLLSDYKRVKDLINLSEDRYVHEGLKGLVRSFNGIIDGIDSLSNKLGDRHRPILKPQRHHAKLVVDGAKTICDFLYSTLEYQSNRKNVLRDELLTILNSNKRSLSKTKLLADAEIKKVMLSCDSFLRRLIKDDLIHDYPVDSYRKSDIFFAMLRLFVDDLTASDISPIFVESQQNDQMIGWKAFQAELQTMKPRLLQEAMDEIYGDQNE
jgi:hypothetical protein